MTGHLRCNLMSDFLDPPFSHCPALSHLSVPAAAGDKTQTGPEDVTFRVQNGVCFGPGGLGWKARAAGSTPGDCSCSCSNTEHRTPPFASSFAASREINRLQRPPPAPCCDLRAPSRRGQISGWKARATGRGVEEGFSGDRSGEPFRRAGYGSARVCGKDAAGSAQPFAIPFASSHEASCLQRIRRAF
jgi:hypothetical protein